MIGNVWEGRGLGEEEVSGEGEGGERETSITLIRLMAVRAARGDLVSLAPLKAPCKLMSMREGGAASPLTAR